MNKIKEAIKAEGGKLKYVVQLEQDNNKMQLYIDSTNAIHFSSDEWTFNRCQTFDLSIESNRIAKEVFLTHLQTEVKTRLLELKQLELVLDELGLKEVIRKTIVDNSSILLNTKEEIIKESIENTNKLIEERVRPIARKSKKKINEVGGNNE